MTEKNFLELLRGYKNNSVDESEIVARLKNFFHYSTKKSDKSTPFAGYFTKKRRD